MAAGLVAIAVVLFLVILFLISAIKVAREYERGIIFRLGRLLPEPKGPGLFLLIPVVDRMVKVDLRTITLNIPPQEVITKDNVPVRVNAVAYFRIVEPKEAIVQVENFMVATSQKAQTTLRAVLGQHVLDELLSEREKINAILQEIIDEATGPWGIKVSAVEVKDVEIPAGMQRAMARQAEAERERRAKIISAEGEFQASERLKDAALVIEKHPTALQLRYLQTHARARRLPAEDGHLPLPDRPDPAVPRRASAAAALDLRTDPLSGRLVVVAPNRRRRPGATAGLIEGPTEDELEECPFCAGRESRTPPESYRVGTAAAWTVRVVPNLYPAFERQEVVVHSPRHVRSFAELTDGEVGAVADAWRARRETALSEGFPYVHALINEGVAAGSSLPHSHSQLVWLREPPPEVVREAGDPAALLGELVVAVRGGMRAAVHHAGRQPYETLIGGEPFDLAGALLLLREVVARLRAVEGPVPWNAWLHRPAEAGQHIELVPRLSVLAGVELGAGIYVNTVAPEDAAAALRR